MHWLPLLLLVPFYLLSPDQRWVGTLLADHGLVVNLMLTYLLFSEFLLRSLEKVLHVRISLLDWKIREIVLDLHFSRSYDHWPEIDTGLAFGPLPGSRAF